MIITKLLLTFCSFTLLCLKPTTLACYNFIDILLINSVHLEDLGHSEVARWLEVTLATHTWKWWRKSHILQKSRNQGELSGWSQDNQQKQVTLSCPPGKAWGTQKIRETQRTLGSLSGNSDGTHCNRDWWHFEGKMKTTLMCSSSRGKSHYH